MPPSTISAINRLGQAEKRAIYARLIPPPLLSRFALAPHLIQDQGGELLRLSSRDGRSDVELALYHQRDFPDPILYGHLTDTLNGQVHVLLYILNDPASPRFDVDRLPDGTPTQFGTKHRNREAEGAALEYGLAPGQVRRGLRLLESAVQSFEDFIVSLGQTMYFTEPLYYHNAVIFERYGFAYQQGRKLMERIQSGFSNGGDLLGKLDGSSLFRQSGAGDSVRLRSWAIHDGLLGEPFTQVTMYKRVGKSAGISTCPDIPW